MEFGGLSHASTTKQARKSLRGPARAGSSLAVPLWIRRSGVQIPAPVFFKPQRLSYDIFLRSGWSQNPHLICKQCHQAKPLSEYYRDARNHWGVRGEACKECLRAKSREWNVANKHLHRKRTADYARENRGKVNARVYKHRASNPLKYKARQALYRAVRSGKLMRGPCAHCGSAVDTHGHHTDYTRPLDVIWLCPDCHRIVHGQQSDLAPQITLKSHREAAA